MICGWPVLKLDSQRWYAFLPPCARGWLCMRLLRPGVLWCMAGTLSRITWNNHLDVRPLGNVTNLLQIQLIRSQSKLCLDQNRYVVQLATEHVVKLTVLDKKKLLPWNHILTWWKSNETHLLHVPFRQLVGSLLWIARHAHHIMQPVACQAQFHTCNDRSHYLAILRVLKHVFTAKDK